jgi:hypothetical protein
MNEHALMRQQAHPTGEREKDMMVRRFVSSRSMPKAVVQAMLAVVVVAAVLAVPSVASTSVTLDGSFFKTFKLPSTDTNRCPPAVDGNECGVMQFAGLGPADYVYKYGPTFEPNGQMGCFNIDGTFTITLQSDGSSISGPLTGVWCKPGLSGDRKGGWNSYGNPFSESDTVTFATGTGQFSGLHGLAEFQQSSAGADWRATLSGSLAS